MYACDLKKQKQGLKRLFLPLQVLLLLPPLLCRIPVYIRCMLFLYDASHVACVRIVHLDTLCMASVLNPDLQSSGSLYPGQVWEEKVLQQRGFGHSSSEYQQHCLCFKVCECMLLLWFHAALPRLEAISCNLSVSGCLVALWLPGCA